VGHGHVEDLGELEQAARADAVEAATPTRPAATTAPATAT
jgi:hypothetical protein